MAQHKKIRKHPPNTGSKLKTHKTPTKRLTYAQYTSVSRCQKILLQGILDPINLYLFMFLYIDHF